MGQDRLQRWEFRCYRRIRLFSLSDDWHFGNKAGLPIEYRRGTLICAKRSKGACAGCSSSDTTLNPLLIIHSPKCFNASVNINDNLTFYQLVTPGILCLDFLHCCCVGEVAPTSRRSSVCYLSSCVIKCKLNLCMRIFVHGILVRELLF
jgi:hypothetical protein